MIKVYVWSGNNQYADVYTLKEFEEAFNNGQICGHIEFVVV